MDILGFRKSTISRYILIGFFALFLIFPIARMFTFLFLYGDWNFLKSKIFLVSLRNSLVSSTVSSFLTVLIAVVVSYFLTRSSIKGKNIFVLLFSLPLLIPSMSLAFGAIILFGTNGFFTRLLHLQHTIYGFSGIVFSSVLYAFPFAFMLLYDVMMYENTDVYEVSDVMGISKFSQFIHLTLSYLKKPLVAVFFLVFATVITDYGVPLMVGSKYQTLPLLMYNEVVGMLNFPRGSLIASFLLLPSFISFVSDILLKNHSKGQSKTKKEFQSSKCINNITYVICTTISVIILLVVFAFIFIAFVKKYPYNLGFTFDNIRKTFALGGKRGLRNSLIISIFTSIFGCFIMFLSSYFTARMKCKSSYILHLFSIISASVPGLVLGLSYSLTFNGFSLYKSIFFIIIVNIIHFASNPYLLSYNALSKLNLNLENVGYTLGLSRFSIVKDVIIPLNRNTIIEMFSYYFMCSMTTISAVAFVANSYNEPLSLMINKFQSQFLLECAASVSFLILLVNLVMRLLMLVLKWGLNRKYQSPKEVV